MLEKSQIFYSDFFFIYNNMKHLKIYENINNKEIKKGDWVST